MKTRTQLIALAVAACAGNVCAQQSEVVVYGLVMPFLEWPSTNGATLGAPADKPTLVNASQYTGINDPIRARISSGTSNLGFRGYEQLSPGLRVTWQLESGFQVDQNTPPGWGFRNSKVGLQGGWGEVFYGQWDTPYKFISLQINPIRAGYVFDYTPIMGNPGMGVPVTTTQFTRAPGKPDAAFDRRTGNTVQYWTPRFGGFSGRLSWSTDEGRTTPTATTASIRPQIWSAEAQYDFGNLSLRYAYEQHDDYFGLSALNSTLGTAPGSLTNQTSKDKAQKVVAIWKIGGTRIAGAYEQLEYKNSDSGTDAMRSYKRDAWYLLIEQTFGQNVLFGSVSQAKDGSCSRNGSSACITNALGAKYYTLGYVYRFSKRTEVFAVWYRIDNKDSGTYATQPLVGATLAPGADTSSAGVGIVHYF